MQRTENDRKWQVDEAVIRKYIQGQEKHEQQLELYLRLLQRVFPKVNAPFKGLPEATRNAGGVSLASIYKTIQI